MYKLLLCVRYLQTRYLAFICIVSVMLGVATLIVVNAVMSGFSTKLKDRLHGVLSDVSVTSDRPDGFEVVRETARDLTPAELWHYRFQALDQKERAMEPMHPLTGDTRKALEATIQVPRPVEVRRYETPHAQVVEFAFGRQMITRRFLNPDGIIHELMNSPAGEHIEAVCPTIGTFAVLQYRYQGTVIAKPVRLIGVDPQARSAVGGFSEYLVRQKDSPKPSFDLTPEALQRHEWNVTQFKQQEEMQRRQRENEQRQEAARQEGPVVPFAPPVPNVNPVPEPDKNAMTVGVEKPKLNGVVLGYSLAHFRYRDKAGNVIEDVALKPGDDVVLTTASGGQDLKPVWGSFIVTDYLKTDMSEYDQSYVYVPLDQLQKIRGMAGRVTELQLKIKNYDKNKKVVSDALRDLYPTHDVHVATWEESQGPLLAAIDVERGILNVLLFMIVGVAGFSILAIFTMIVSEKYRDIGIMKSLGASSWGVMQIFVGYGLLLGAVGCSLGTGLGLLITWKINEIEAFLARQTGKELFPRDVYYFKEIPTNVEPSTVGVIVVGAVVIATVFSLLPAWRAARLHPVQALRSE